jgi:hypothetical protein
MDPSKRKQAPDHSEGTGEVKRNKHADRATGEHSRAPTGESPYIPPKGKDVAGHRAAEVDEQTASAKVCSLTSDRMPHTQPGAMT